MNRPNIQRWRGLSRRGALAGSTAVALTSLSTRAFATENFSDPALYERAKPTFTEKIPSISFTFSNFTLGTSGLWVVWVQFNPPVITPASGVTIAGDDDVEFTQSRAPVFKLAYALVAEPVGGNLLAFDFSMRPFGVGDEMYVDADLEKTVLDLYVDDVLIADFRRHAASPTKAGPQFTRLSEKPAQTIIDALSSGQRYKVVYSVNDTMVLTATGNLGGFRDVYTIAAAELAWRQEQSRLGRRPAFEADGTRKIICTAMNERYGFGGFRNALWQRYAAMHLTPAHERGYHALGLPLIAFAYGGETWARRRVRVVLEHMARQRTADIWAQMRGGRRRLVVRLYRVAIELLCFLIGTTLALCDRIRSPRTRG